MKMLVISCAAVALPVVIWVLFRRGGDRRRPLDRPPGADWKPTGERFLDSASGQTLDVWHHPRSGERAYVRAR